MHFLIQFIHLCLLCQEVRNTSITFLNSLVCEDITISTNIIHFIHRHKPLLTWQYMLHTIFQINLVYLFLIMFQCHVHLLCEICFYSPLVHYLVIIVKYLYQMFIINPFQCRIITITNLCLNILFFR